VLHAGPHAAQIHGIHLVESCKCFIGHITNRPEDAGIVIRHVQPAEFINRSGDHPGGLGFIPHIATPQELTSHNCINLRLPTLGGLYAWEFEKNGRELRVRVEGQLIFNGTAPMLDAALSGLGLAYLPVDSVQAHLDDGRLVQVLADWCPPYPGYHLYYPSRRQPMRAFSLLVEALRYKR
jgi:DNA-binding transcriptional LysR family regulator